MRNFIERQGKSGSRRLSVFHGRFGGDHASEVGESDRARRLAVMERDDRRIFSRLLVDECCGAMVGDHVDIEPGTNQRICLHTGVNIPARGGVVRLDGDRSRRQPKLVFGDNGMLVAAHF